MRFNYEGHDRLGQPVVGSVDAPTEADAAQAIRKERGHYAREISTEEIRPKYEVPAVGGVADSVPVPVPVDDVGDGVFASAEVGQAVSEVREKVSGMVTGPGKPSGSRVDVLREDLEGISEVLRQMHVWRAAYRASVEGNGSPLPSGFPAVGGKTWECYDKNFDDVVGRLFGEAMARAAFMRPS